MTKDVERAPHWPHNQWHPAYLSVKEWLDNEAPTTGTDAFTKKRNQKNRIRLGKPRA